MKKLVLMISVFVFASAVNAQNLKNSGAKCDWYWNDAAKDCSAKSGICCLSTVVVNPKIFDLRLLSTWIEKDDRAKIREMAKSGLLTKAIGEKTATRGLWPEIITGLSNGIMILEKITFPPNAKAKGVEALVRRVSAGNSKKHDYVGHVTLLR